jgi:hypothetical protein
MLSGRACCVAVRLPEARLPGASKRWKLAQEATYTLRSQRLRWLAWMRERGMASEAGEARQPGAAARPLAPSLPEAAAQTRVLS